jgi:hypothetical protein
MSDKKQTPIKQESFTSPDGSVCIKTTIADVKKPKEVISVLDETSGRFKETNMQILNG